MENDSIKIVSDYVYNILLLSVSDSFIQRIFPWTLLTPHKLASGSPYTNLLLALTHNSMTTVETAYIQIQALYSNEGLKLKDPLTIYKHVSAVCSLFAAFIKVGNLLKGLKHLKIKSCHFCY